METMLFKRLSNEIPAENLEIAAIFSTFLS